MNLPPNPPLPVTDIINRKIEVNDLVVFYGNVYKVLGVGNGSKTGSGYVKMILFSKSKTTKSVTKFSKEMCLINKLDATKWMLEQSA